MIHTNPRMQNPVSLSIPRKLSKQKPIPVISFFPFLNYQSTAAADMEGFYFAGDVAYPQLSYGPVAVIGGYH